MLRRTLRRHCTLATWHAQCNKLASDQDVSSLSAMQWSQRTTHTNSIYVRTYNSIYTYITALCRPPIVGDITKSLAQLCLLRVTVTTRMTRYSFGCRSGTNVTEANNSFPFGFQESSPGESPCLTLQTRRAHGWELTGAWVVLLLLCWVDIVWNYPLNSNLYPRISTSQISSERFFVECVAVRAEVRIRMFSFKPDIYSAAPLNEAQRPLTKTGWKIVKRGQGNKTVSSRHDLTNEIMNSGQ